MEGDGSTLPADAAGAGVQAAALADCLARAACAPTERAEAGASPAPHGAGSEGTDTDSDAGPAHAAEGDQPGDQPERHIKSRRKATQRPVVRAWFELLRIARKPAAV